MRSRAAILAFPGDPYLLNYWLSLYDRFWQPEIDKLYIHLNSTIEPEMVKYIKDRCDKSKNIYFIYSNVQKEHGQVIAETLDFVTEEYVMLIEDDGFIFKSGAVDHCFLQLESGNYDIVGSSRGSCAQEILDQAQKLWNINYDGEGDQGPNFWPSFFFTRKDLYDRTDKNFGAKAWYKGDKIAALGDYEVIGDAAYGDTMVHMSLQLRSVVQKHRILIVPQYHGHPDDVEHYERKYAYSMFNGIASWCHIGSLSSGVGGILRDQNDRALARRKIDVPKTETILNPDWCKTDFERREFERRVQWWARFYDFADIRNGDDDFYTAYGIAVMQIIAQYKLNTKAIHQRQRIYATLGL